MTSLLDVVGMRVAFYGVDGNTFKLDTLVFEAVEDECDGYRSMLGDIVTRDPVGLIFFGSPIAEVAVQHDADIGGYRLVDVVDDHVWLRLGTDHADDYYPCFLFRYAPKETP